MSLSLKSVMMAAAFTLFESLISSYSSLDTSEYIVITFELQIDQSINFQ